jgi:LmbE family N-acetylglucosaminyl deacetylase
VSCAAQRDLATAPPCLPVPGELTVAAPAEPTCDDAELTAYDALLVLAPHPDDETLGFAGLRSAFHAQGKPVDTVVVTDGDAYCEACSLWKSLSTRGATCGVEDLSNLATPEVDSFAEVRRAESAAAAEILGLPAPELLGYPDTGLAAAWTNARRGRPGERLRRSDFSACLDCATCAGGYGEGPETDLTAATLMETLAARLAATSPRALVATTHWLDGHGDHSALGNFVKTLNDALDEPRPVAYAVIHAHTPKETPHPDCWYPAPAAPVCPCMEESCAVADPGRVAALQRLRLRPEWPAALPDDAPYGEEKQVCLPEEIYRGAGATKLLAVEAYPSQLGSLAREGTMPAHLDAMMDCNGYLVSFVRRTEAFVLPEPVACDPVGAWRGAGGSSGNGSTAEHSDVTLTLKAESPGRVSGALTWSGEGDAKVRQALAGAVGDGCDLELHGTEGDAATYRATISRDGKSMYGSWNGEVAGYFVVHR